MRDLCGSIILNLIAIDPCCSYTETEAQTVATCPQLDVLFPFSMVFSVNNWTMLPPEESALFTVTKLYCLQLQARNFFSRFRGRQRFSIFFVKKSATTKSDTKEIFCVKSILWIANCLRSFILLDCLHDLSISVCKHTETADKKLNEFCVFQWTFE